MTAIGVLVFTAAMIVGVLWGRARLRSTGSIAMLLGVGLAGVTFQLVHGIEHILQFGYWALNPDEKPIITPWAGQAAKGLTYWCQALPGNGQNTVVPARGNESLHLIGNVIFICALIALMSAAKARFPTDKLPTALKICFGLETVHVVEHVFLTITIISTGTARGLSTLFGIPDSGSTFLTSYRLIWHFGMNTFGLITGLWGVYALWRKGLFRRERAAEVVAAAPPAAPVLV